MIRGGKMRKLGVIGGGAMGSAIISGLLSQNCMAAKDIYLLETDQAKIRYFEENLKVATAPSTAALALECEFIVLAVKPQVLPEIARELGPVLGADHCLISIAAGITLNELAKWFPQARLIRVMPNTALRVGRGVSVYCPGQLATAADETLVTRVFGALGQVLRLAEKLFDAVTAISGSGPAYVFYLIEALTDAAVMLGLGRIEAEMMVAETFAGSVALLQQTGEHPAKLRNQVTSPGGTTAAALFELEKGAVAGSLQRAALAAAKRSQELVGGR
jgi:pyrroline-5-carboxylate reductase